MKFLLDFKQMYAIITASKTPTTDPIITIIKCERISRSK